LDNSRYYFRDDGYNNIVRLYNFSFGIENMMSEMYDVSKIKPMLIKVSLVLLVKCQYLLFLPHGLV